MGLGTNQQCYAAIIICVTFFTTAKMALSVASCPNKSYEAHVLNRYIFLLERIHIVRAPFVKNRFRDWIWCTGMLIIVIGYGALCIVCYITPHHEISQVDGHCRIGVTPVASYFLLASDTFINTACTIVFVLLLRPALRFNSVTTTTSSKQTETSNRSYLQRALTRVTSLRSKEVEAADGNTRFWTNIRLLLWKNVIGSSLISLASIANLIGFYIEKQLQYGWLCLVSCMADSEYRDTLYSVST